MATGRRAALTNDSNIPSQNDPGRELFEACRNGDLNKVKKLVSSSNVNAKDTAGRKSTPLHFAAGLFLVPFFPHITASGSYLDLGLHQYYIHEPGNLPLKI